ncbi:MAG TPA: hypothetical protein VD994_13290, partial [Prosthecobacter sp.]|nr:hypothetical protein [Prosthecobacter sp.]
MEQEIKHPVQIGAAEEAAQTPLTGAAAPAPRLRPKILLSLPVAAIIALAVHWLVGKSEPPVETRTYTLFLNGVLGLSVLLALIQPWWSGLRR